MINSPHAAGRRPQRAGIVPPLVLAVAVGWAAGCGRTVPPTAAPAVAAPAPAFADQLAAVRAGVATAIHVADRPLESHEWESLRGLAELRELVLDRGRADDSRADVIGSLVPGEVDLVSFEVREILLRLCRCGSSQTRVVFNLPTLAVIILLLPVVILRNGKKRLLSLSLGAFDNGRNELLQKSFNS